MPTLISGYERTREVPSWGRVYTLIDVGMVAGNRRHCFAAYHLHQSGVQRGGRKETAKIAICSLLAVPPWPWFSGIDCSLVCGNRSPKKESNPFL